jgi:hypothetical protein
LGIVLKSIDAGTSSPRRQLSTWSMATNCRLTGAKRIDGINKGPAKWTSVLFATVSFILLLVRRLSTSLNRRATSKEVAVDLRCSIDTTKRLCVWGMGSTVV